MKKILSFLTKKPLALAAVALFSMSAFAEAPAAATQKIWSKVTDPSLLGVKPFLKVTLVDPVQKVVYTVDETTGAQTEAVPFVSGVDAEQNGSYLYACEGTPVQLGGVGAFTLNTKPDGTGDFINRDGVIEKRDPDPDVSWKKDLTVAIWNEAWSERYIYYDYNPKRIFGI